MGNESEKNKTAENYISNLKKKVVAVLDDCGHTHLEQGDFIDLSCFEHYGKATFFLEVDLDEEGGKKRKYFCTLEKSEGVYGFSVKITPDQFYFNPKTFPRLCGILLKRGWNYNRNRIYEYRVSSVDKFSELVGEVEYVLIRTADYLQKRKELDREHEEKSKDLTKELIKKLVSNE